MTELSAANTGNGYLNRTIAAARVLDAASALAANPCRVVPRNSNGAVVSPLTWALAGLHTLRAQPAYSAYFAPEDTAASKTWLTENGWSLPA